MSFGLESLFVDHGRAASRKKRVLRGVLVLVFSLFVLFALGWGTLDARAHAHWIPTPARMLASEVDISDQETAYPYSISVSYQYCVNGAAQTGTVYRGGYHTASAAAAYALARALAPGSTTTCFVDPADASRAVLELPSVVMWESLTAAAAALSIALLFGYVIPQITRGPPSGPVSRRGGVFLLGGLVIAGVAYLMWASLLPLWRNSVATVWIPVPASVEHARLIAALQHGEVPFTLYRTDLLYRYTVADVEYHSNQYSFTELSSPFAGGRRRRVGQLAALPKLFCYVDPRHPERAVLTRAVSPTQLPDVWAVLLGGLGVYALVPRRLRAGFDAALRQSRWTIGGLLVILVGITALGLIVMP